MLKTKTGVTGQLVLGSGLVATLLSKEIYVVTAEVGIINLIVANVIATIIKY